MRIWHALSDVPGWPDAPARVRFRRFLPIFVPCVGIASLLAWWVLAHRPHVRSLEIKYAPAVELAREVDRLKLKWSDNETIELESRAEAASKQLLDDPEAVPALLAQIRDGCDDVGWDASLQAFDSGDEMTIEGTPIEFVPVLAKLTPRPEATDVCGSLVGILERIHSHAIWTDLTRMEVHANDDGIEVVEMNLRVGLLKDHEEAFE